MVVLTVSLDIALTNGGRKRLGRSNGDAGVEFVGVAE